VRAGVKDFEPFTKLAQDEGNKNNAVPSRRREWVRFPVFVFGIGIGIGIGIGELDGVD
jgi:hypothetical protein